MRDKEEAKYLPEKQAEMFHHTVAQLLFLCMQSRRDIQTSVSFLTTRVRRPDKDDWGKVKRILKYLKGTWSLALRLSVNNMSFSVWFIDASHAIHWNCRGQTGVGVTLGMGAVISASWKQKLNTYSSLPPAVPVYCMRSVNEPDRK